MKPSEYRRIREGLGSQTEVAKILDVNMHTIDRRENGWRRVRREAEFALLWAEREARLRKPVKRAAAKKPTMRKAQTDRRAAEFARCYGSAERVRWVSEIPCSVPRCKLQHGPSENAHSVGGGMSRKANADTILPLCKAHHKEQHKIGVRTFEKKYGIDLQAEARATEASWRIHENALTGKA